MRIVYLRATNVKYDPRVQKECNSLLKGGHSITIISWDRNSSLDYKEDCLKLDYGLIKVVYIGALATWGGGPKKNLKGLLRFVKLTKNWIKNNSTFDAIHFCEMPVALLLIRTAKKYSFKIVYDIYDYYPDLRNNPKIVRNFLIRCENKVIKESDAIIICTEERKKQIGKAKYKKLYVIHNSPSNIELGECEIQSKNNSLRFVYVGNLVEERLISIILDYFGKHKEYELHIGGIGVLTKAVETTARDSTNIFYYGKMEYKDVLSLEMQCDVMIALYDPKIPNHKYVAANKFYESLFLGKPIIMCKGTGLDTIVDKESIGATIEPSFKGISEGVASIVNKKETWDKLSAREKELFNANYSWNIMEKRLLTLYEELS